MTGPGPFDHLTSEELREALVDLDRLRVKEQRQRLENEVLLCGLHAVSRPRPPRLIFHELVRVFQEVIAFEEAAVFLIRENRLRLWAATQKRKFQKSCALDGPLSRAAKGDVIAGFDTSRWSSNPLCDPNGCSALIFSIRTDSMHALIFCSHQRRGFFTSAHQRLVRRFAPLATQALVTAEGFEGRATRDRLIAERAAATQHISFLERAVEDLGVGVCTLSHRELGWISEALRHLLDGFDDPASWWRALQEAARLDSLFSGCREGDGGTKNRSFEAHLIDDRGQDRSFRLTCSQLDDSGAQLLLLVNEFTDRVAAERALRESQTQKAAILDAANDGVVTLDYDGNILGLNLAAEKILDLSEEDVVGLDWGLLIRMPARATSRETLHHWADLEDQIELTVARPDGIDTPIEVSVIRLIDQDKTIYAAFIRDITERKTAEAQLRAVKASAEEANLSKTQFLASMSHELRTPLNVISGALELLSEEEMGESQQQWLRTAVDNAHTLSHLIGEILDMTRVDSGGLELKATDIRLQDLIDDLTLTFHPKAAEKGLELKTRVDPKIGPKLEIDPHRLKQILTNLLDNAIKFSDRGTVELEAAVIADRAGRQKVRFTVTDTGIGFPEDAGEHIFRPYRQLDGSSKRAYGGVGLGLAISQTLAELMGGRIRARSRPGVGSRFELDLTIAKGTAGETPPESVDDSTDVEPQRILLVEDHAGNRLLAERFLSSAGHRVTAVSDGPSAMDRFRQESFDLVLLDIQMPHMDGLEVARRLRSFESTFGRAPTTVLALTAHALERYETESREAGMDGFLVKPIQRKALIRAVAEAARGCPTNHGCPTKAPTSDAVAEAPVEWIEVDDGILDLIPAFFQQRRDDIAALEKADSESDFERIQHIGHGLKGCGSSYGFPYITQLGTRLEDAAKARDPSTITASIKDLGHYLASVKVRSASGTLVYGEGGVEERSD